MNRRELLLAGASLAACSPATSQAPAPAFPMRRGVNLGNALEAPNEGDWGYRIEAPHLAAIAEAGFDGVRLPVRWDAHAGASRPYTIDDAFFARVEEVVNAALLAGLHVQLDCHHYDALIANPGRERARFLAIWRQIAARFQQAPPQLIFEPLNEPNGEAWNGRVLTRLQADVVGAIRESNAARLIVLGPGNWQNIDALRDWTPPAGANIAVSVHYYEPHAFTHQGAEWLGADAPRFGREWGTDADFDLVERHIAQAADWGARHGYPMQLGEFGVNRAVYVTQRAFWTAAVRRECERHNMAWCYWDFAGAFAVWDRDQGRWNDRLLGPLMRGPPPPQ